MIDLNHPEVQFALDVVRTAGRLAAEIQQEMITPAIAKDDKSPVTVADFAIQAVVGSVIDRAFPNDSLLGEEGSAALRDEAGRDTLDAVVGFVSRAVAYATHSTVCEYIDRGCGEPGKRFWTLDPIDGTKGFLRKDQYALALALIEDGQVTLGVLGCPNLTEGYQSDPGGPGTIVIAQRGHGAYMTPLQTEGELTPMKVSGETNPQAARVLRSFEKAHTNLSQLDHVLAAFSNTADPVRMDSQAKYSVLGAGQAELLFRLLSPKQPDYREMIWDQAAGSIVVEESGGRITDLSGKRLDFSAGQTLANNRGVLASNGPLHDAALAALTSVGAVP